MFCPTSLVFKPEGSLCGRVRGGGIQRLTDGAVCGHSTWLCPVTRQIFRNRFANLHRTRDKVPAACQQRAWCHDYIQQPIREWNCKHTMKIQRSTSWQHKYGISTRKKRPYMVLILRDWQPWQKRSSILSRTDQWTINTNMDRADSNRTPFFKKHYPITSQLSNSKLT